MSFALRAYQQQAVEAVQRDWRGGTPSVLVTMATGLGKTAVLLELLRRELDEHPTRRALILAHRKELIDQPLERARQYFPEWAAGRCGAVMADRDECDRQLTVATVQTLASPARLERLLAYGPMDYLVTDECHHATARTYRRVVDALREANPRLWHLGVTATPLRADGEGLRAVYQKEAYHMGIREGVQSAWLVPPRWLAIQTGISLAGVEVRAGDYVGKQLADVFETANCFDLVVESHQRYAAERQAIAFVESVEGAYRLAEAFREAGITAEAADGTTHKAEREEILRRFRQGKTSVLCNVGLYTEGLDVPQISCVHQVRPTQSDGLYLQCIGRALRPVPGKEDALILDYAPLEARNVVMLGDVLGVPARKEAYISETAERGEVAAGFTFDGEIKWLRGDPAEIVSRQLDYLDLSPYVWHRSGDSWMTLGLGDDAELRDRTLALSPADADALCCLYIITRDRTHRSEDMRLLARGPFEEVSEQAQALAEREGNLYLTAKSRTWRRQEPTEKQRQYAERLGVWQEGLSKGEIATRITHALAMRVVRRYQGGTLLEGVA